MGERNFNTLIDAQWSARKYLCVGLDPDLEKIPQALRNESLSETILAFNRHIVDATKDIVACFKPNSAFYEGHGEEGWRALKETVAYIKGEVPEVPIILDAKRGDIGNTNNGYVRMAFDLLEVDAVTVHSYMGEEALEPFFARKEKGILILCKTSNSGAGEFQDLSVNGEPLYIHVARAVSEKWNKNGNCGLVVGATYPEELVAVRSVAPKLPVLIPGVGAQGGAREASVRAGMDADKKGIIVSASRSVLFASDGTDFADKARAEAQSLHDAIVKAV